MSDTSENTTAHVLIESAVRSVGKREFLKTIEKMFGLSRTKSKVVSDQPKKRGPKPGSVRKPRVIEEVSSENRCCARVKGDIVNVIGNRHLYASEQCTRSRLDAEGGLCAIHRNQVGKFGDLPDGRVNTPLTEQQQKKFVA